MNAKTPAICVSGIVLARFFVVFKFRAGSMKSLQRFSLADSHNPPLPPFDLIRARIITRAARIRRSYIVETCLDSTCIRYCIYRKVNR